MTPLRPIIRSTRKPKMSDHKGATWDYIHIVLKDGKRIKGYLDTTWGNYVYFPLNGKWKKVGVEHIDSNLWEIRL